MQPDQLRIAINGCGRIGGAVAKILLLGEEPNLRLVAINDHATAYELQGYLQRDSVYGRFPLPVRLSGQELIVGATVVKTFQKEEPELLPWGKLKVDVVVESTGSFTSEREARRHLRAGAKTVLISTAPHAGRVEFFVQGAGAKTGSLQGPILSHASCTTTAVAPVMSMLQENFTVKAWTLFAVQSVTHSQEVVDKAHGEGRRRRQALDNIVPITLDTDRALPYVFSKNLLNYAGQGVRVPTTIVHLAMLTVLLKERTTPAEINTALRRAARTHNWQGLVRVSDELLVSQDLRQTSQSATIDAGLTKVAGGNLVQLGVWYDNEWAFAQRLVDLLSKLAKG
ncbi:MAG: glyceraldehyde 3-phosphate dehydrogenase NAD-binding domain-containing protein [Parcubacteria group bacterium]